MNRLHANQHPSAEELRNIFASAPRDFGPVPIWWWSGGKVTREGIRHQMERMARGGLCNVMILNLAPCGTIFGCCPDNPRFLSEGWWENFAFAVEEGKRLGIRLWFYDQLGFSGASLQAGLVTRHPGFQGVRLVREFRDVEGPSELVLPLPPLGTLVSAFIGEIVDRAQLPHDSCSTGVALRNVRAVSQAVQDGVLKMKVMAGRHRVMLFATVPAGYDYHNGEACAALLQQVHGEIERRLAPELGRGIVGSFQDEFPALPRFSRGFPEAFQQRAGYDIIAHLPALFDDVVDGCDERNELSSVRIRCDAARVAAQLCAEALFQPLAAWHDRREMLCGFDQFVRNADPLDGENYYIDFFRTQRHFSAPGNEQIGDAKPHQSLADLYGHPRVWMEGYHSAGWGQTLEDIVTLLHPWMVDGATLYNPHAIYYASHGSYWEWAPPDNGWRQPYFFHYPALVDYISRLCYILSRGDHVVHDALLMPSSTVHACSGWGEKKGAEAVKRENEHHPHTHLLQELLGETGEAAKRADEAYWAFQHQLRKDHRDYIIIDEDSVQRAKIGQGTLMIRSLQIQRLTLPSCCVLEGNTLRKLVEFAEAGGRVLLVGEAPRSGADGALSPAEFEALAHRLRARSEPYADGTTAAQALGVRPAAATGGNPLPCLRRSVRDRNFFFVRSDTTIAANLAALREVNHVKHWESFAAQGGRLSASLLADGIPEFWSAASGKIVPLLNYRRSAAEGTTCVEVELSDTPTPLIALRPAEPQDPLAIESDLEITRCERRGDRVEITGLERFDRTRPPPPEHRVRVVYADAEFRSAVAAEPLRTFELAEPFECRIAPSCDNEDGSFDWPPSPGPIPVVRRSFRFREEAENEDVAPWRGRDFDDSGWATTLASFGPRAEFAGPVVVRAGETFETMARPCLKTDGFHPLTYSQKLGIENDRVFRSALGGKARISEEFIEIPDAQPGEIYIVRTTVTVPADALQALLRIGGVARKRAFLNGEEIHFAGARQAQRLCAPVSLRSGRNCLEVLATREGPGPLRVFYHFLPGDAAPADPEWIWYGGVRQTGTVRFATTFMVPGSISSASLSVALANLRHQVRINGTVVGDRGGFDPYFSSRADHYDIASLLREGENRVEVVVLYAGDSLGKEDRPIGLLVDGLVTTNDQRTVAFVSGPSFATCCLDDAGRVRGEERPACVLPRPLNDYMGDPANLLLYPRPHPLREAGWLQDQPPLADPFDRIVYSVGERKPKRTWYRFLVPPGATSLRFAVHGPARLYIEGVEVPVELRDKDEPLHHYAARIPQPESCRRMAALCVDPADGFEHGAAIAEPVRFEIGPGKIALGSWDELGLRHYSGGLVYSQSFSLEAKPTGKVVLDLGRVRGSADVTVNGVSCGQRLWHPYRFDLTEAIQAGKNRTEIRVYNTLAPHYGEGHPSAYVYENHTQSGVWGPVSVGVCREIRMVLKRA